MAVGSGRQCLKAFVLYIAEAYYEDCTQHIFSFICLFIHLFKLKNEWGHNFLSIFAALKKSKVVDPIEK